MLFEDDKPIAEIGEKALIRHFIRPLFEGGHLTSMLGNDCAVLEMAFGLDVVVSTDRVPSDLIAFRYGLIDHGGIGRYLATLNLSDLAAAGSKPVAMLLNLGMPSSVTFGQLKAFCVEFKKVVELANARVIGGDITSAREFSASATAIGVVPRGTALSRGSARPGDYIFVSKPFGVTPAAFEWLVTLEMADELSEHRNCLVQNFVNPEAQIELGNELRKSGVCTSCIDNTDGYSECFYELSIESSVKFVLLYDDVVIPCAVKAVAGFIKSNELDIALKAGADFGLVGTVSEPALIESLSQSWPSLQIIGRVEAGKGVFIRKNDQEVDVLRSGWNYFSKAL